jgi:hypothetical protein
MVVPSAEVTVGWIVLVVMSVAPIGKVEQEI